MTGTRPGATKWKPAVPRKARLRLKPSDRLLFRMTEAGVLLDQEPPNEADDPFVIFSAWSKEADEKTYAHL